MNKMRCDKIVCVVLVIALMGSAVVGMNDAQLLQLLKNEPYNPDIDLDTQNMIRRHNYPAESHVVKTEDGYLLTMHRIPSGRGTYYNTTKKDAVLVLHGLFSSSADWIIPGPDQALPYILADAGYDVWLGNIRGNTYSRSHTTLSTKNPKYWDFSFDEMGYYDLPAMIDYILGKTGNTQLFYIGHSMGTAVGYALGSSRREYNDKIKAMISLGPSAFFSRMESPIRLLVPFSRTLDFILQFLTPGELAPNTMLSRYINKLGCDLTKINRETCLYLGFLVVGYDREQFNTTQFPVFLSHEPSGGSIRNVLHYAQLIKSGTFQPYNCTSKLSYRKCINKPPVPSYNLNDITAPVSLHYANNDKIANVKDVEELRSQLRNVIGYYKIPFEQFNHIDFLAAKDAPTLVYDKVLEVMHNVQSGKMDTARDYVSYSLKHVEVKTVDDGVRLSDFLSSSKFPYTLYQVMNV